MATFNEIMEDYRQFKSVRGDNSPEYLAKLQEVTDLIEGRGIPSHKRQYLLREAMTTADFPQLFGDVLDRELLATYKAVSPAWQAFTKKSTVSDFRTANRFAITNGDQMLSQVAEKGEYLASDRDEEEYTIKAYKYGRQFDISWESIINDDLDALKDTPQRFATAVMRTEHYQVTNQYAGDVGTHTANANLFESGVNCVATALTIASLGTGITYMNSQTDANGEPFLTTPRFLVVPPALEITARQIITSTTNTWQQDTDSTVDAFQLPTANVLPQYGLQLIVDRYLPVCDTTSDNEGWYLFCSPTDIPCIEIAHLRGHESPEICMKASDKVAVGGASPLPSMSGDFATDNILYRVRHVFGVATLDHYGCYMGGYQG